MDEWIKLHNKHGAMGRAREDGPVLEIVCNVHRLGFERWRRKNDICIMAF